jgi:hypothetical protein
MKSQQAIENFKTMNCAQSVLTAFAPDFRLDEKTAIRIAAGFGSGMERAIPAERSPEHTW